MTEQEKVSSGERMADIMFAVMQTGGEWFTHTSIMRKVRLPQATTNRYLRDLVRKQYLEQNEVDATVRKSVYRLTPKSTGMLKVQGLRLIHSPRREGESA